MRSADGSGAAFIATDCPAGPVGVGTRSDELSDIFPRVPHARCPRLAKFGKKPRNEERGGCEAQNKPVSKRLRPTTLHRGLDRCGHEKSSQGELFMCYR